MDGFENRNSNRVKCRWLVVVSVYATADCGFSGTEVFYRNSPGSFLAVHVQQTLGLFLAISKLNLSVLADQTNNSNCLIQIRLEPLTVSGTHKLLP